MIYIFSGNDIQKRSARIQKIVALKETIFLSKRDEMKQELLALSSSTSLFGETPVVILENALAGAAAPIGVVDLKILALSPMICIFLEEKLLKKDETKYAKYATIESFIEKKTESKQVFNTFALADAFGRNDKIGAWILYREAIEKGVEPEAVSGMLFWKIKQMILSSPKAPSASVLKKQSSELVSLYHKAHTGDCDFIVGLEQFLLSALSKKVL